MLVTVTPSRKPARQLAGMAILNRCLAVAAVILAALVVFEIWSGLRSAATELPPGAAPALGDARPAPPLPARDQVIAAFAQRDIFALPLSPTGTVDKATLQAAPVEHARRSWKLIGISPVSEGVIEAIIADKTSGKMYFVRKGQNVTVTLPAEPGKAPPPGETVLVKDIRKDSVILLYKDDEFAVK